MRMKCPSFTPPAYQYLYCNHTAHWHTVSSAITRHLCLVRARVTESRLIKLGSDQKNNLARHPNQLTYVCESARYTNDIHLSSNHVIADWHWRSTRNSRTDYFPPTSWHEILKFGSWIRNHSRRAISTSPLLVNHFIQQRFISCQTLLTVCHTRLSETVS